MAIVLVVDDSLLARHAVRLALQSQNHEVLEASDGIAGLMVARACLPDVVISATKLPATNGPEMLDALEREGHSATGILIEAPGASAAGGASGSITLRRPLCTKQIRAAVAAVLAQRPLQRAA